MAQGPSASLYISRRSHPESFATTLDTQQISELGGPGMFTFLRDKSEEREMNNYLDWQNSRQQLTRSRNIQQVEVDSSSSDHRLCC